MALQEVTAKDRIELLKQFPRAICHMRQQLAHEELGLIFGAGASLPYGFPKWSQLLERIGANLGIDDWPTVAQLSPAMTAEVLFHRFRQKNQTIEGPTFADVAAIEDANWRQLVHGRLYENVPEDLSEIDTHIYDWFAPVVEKSGLTINYNFDDTLERVLEQRAHDKEEGDPSRRGFEVVLEPLLSRRGLGNTRVYHPNGFLPRVLHDGSTSITFSQTGFADQLLQSGTAEFAPLLTLLRLQTFLLIGLSLDDEILRNILRQHARIDVSSVHYYIKHVGADVKLSPQDMDAIRSANFETYNLITLFLDSHQLSTLASLLSIPRDKFIDECVDGADQPLSRTFYVTGAIGVGKSSVTRSFRDLVTFDEWSRQRPFELNKPAKDLTDNELDQIDDWIATQMRIRNRKIQDARDEPGMQVVDRTPLDPLVFTPGGDFQSKAMKLKDQMRGRIAPGQVLVLIGSPDELKIRVETRFKTATSQHIEEQQSLLTSLFPKSTDPNAKSIKYIDTRGLPLRQMVKQIVREIHLGNDAVFAELDLELHLNEVAKGAIELVPDLDQ